jgi:hypothetical protein
MNRLVATAAALFAAVPSLALAAAAAPAANDPLGGLVVRGQPRDAYVIRINTQGKDESTIRKEIWGASWEACQKAPRTANVLEVRPTYMTWCASQAAYDAMRQLDDVLAKRRQTTNIDVAGYGELP